MSLINAGGLTDLPGAALGAVTDPIANLGKGTFDVLFGQSKRPERGPDFPDGFQIIEVIDGQENKESLVRLTGNMLPIIPFEWGGEQRLNKDYYVGNPEPAVHVLGSKEGDLTIHGKFKDKKLKYSDQNYGVAYKLADYLHKLARRGSILKISLGPWVRYAFLEKVDFKLNKLSEVEYQLTFFVVGLNPPINAKLIKKTKDVPLDDTKKLIDAMSTFSATYSAVPKSMPKSIGDVLKGAIGDVAKAVNLVTNFVNSYVAIAEDIQASANRAIGLIKNARTNVAQFKRRIGSLQTGFNSLSTDAKASTKFQSVLTNQQHLVNSMSAASSLSALLAQMQKQFEALARQTPMARYKVKDGDTLQRIAIKYYNNADNWQQIYDHNKLTTTALTMGMMLEIPKL